MGEDCWGLGRRVGGFKYFCILGECIFAGILVSVYLRIFSGDSGNSNPNYSVYPNTLYQGFGLVGPLSILCRDICQGLLFQGCLVICLRLNLGLS